MFRFVRIFTKGTAFHASIGFYFGLFYIWFLTGWEIQETSTSVINTLITVTASLLAAGAAIAAAVYDSENKRIASLKAARATLPLALSNLSQACTNGAIYSYCRHPKKPETVSFEVPSDTIEIFKACIEYSDPISARWLSAILARFQVLTSRTSNPTFEGSDRKMAADWLLLERVIGHCFSFARSPDSSVSIPEIINLEKGFDYFNVEDACGTDIADVAELIRDKISRLQGVLEEFEGGSIQSKEDRSKAGR